jgi:hypothetical protein
MNVSVMILFLINLLLAEPNPIQAKSGSSLDDDDIRHLWTDCKVDKTLSFEIFNDAVTGYRHMDSIWKKDIITIIDFSKPSTDKRLYVIDINNRKILYNCFVAHGKNSGDNLAVSFSNQPESLKSSLGFFITAETYSGKHGYSLRLDGLEKNINDNARPREIVIHGADYVSQQFIDEHGRLGRSWGCPAVPVEISREVIDRISNGSCLFIYARDKSYFVNSGYINIKD